MPDGPLSPEEVAHRGFSTAFRGFDTGEVRAYLQRVANELRESVGRERDLNRRLTEAEHRAAHPVIEGEALTRLLGEEMARIVASAQHAAGELKARAEENAARILREAHDQAQHIRAKAEVVLAERTEEAEAEAEEIRRVAAAEAASVVERGQRQAAEAAAQAEARGREVVEEAQAVRSRVLGDLTRRRRLLQMQVETLRAGRERLVEAYRVVRRSVDEVADELQRAETEAREAASAAGERAAADVDLDDDPSALGSPAAPPGPTAEAPSAADTSVDEAHEGSAAPGTPSGEADRPPPQLRLLPSLDPAASPPPPPAPAPPSEPAAALEEPPALPAATDSDPEPVAAAVDVPPPVEAAEETQGAEPSPDAEVPGAEHPAVAPSPELAPAKAADPPGEGVDALFARIRAGRADAVAKAHEVLRDEPPVVPEVEEEAAPPHGAAADDESLLQQRDAAVEGVEARLARKLKRALQDEQNELLDRLRSARAGAGPDDLLPAAAEQVARYVLAADELVRAAATAGASCATPDAGDPRPRVDDVVHELASSIAEPLRRALERAVRSDADAGPGDQSAMVERIGSVYRECKAQRLEGLAGDAVTAAFSRGALAALGPGVSSRWVVDDGGRPCPDCDDNALAGPTPPGEPFPTGQAHPPAHGGCRCLLAPAEVAAAVNGTG